MTSNKTSDITMVDSVDENVDSVFLTESDNKEGMKGGAEEEIREDNTNCENHSANISTEVNNANTSQLKPIIKKKHRRGSRRNKRRKYKPYSELTWEEKKAVEERDSRRAVSIRKKYMHDKGRPLAPFNTSQFLMAEHDTKEPDLHISHHHHHETHTSISSSADDTDYGESSLSNEEHDIEEARNFLQKDFRETYDRLHSESLHRMNKAELVNEYMQLEDKVENLEKELKVIKSNSVKVTNGYYTLDQTPVLEVDQDDESHETSRHKLELEIQKLREENKQLHLENSILQPRGNPKEDASV